jgi:hypothetical protein
MIGFVRRQCRRTDEIRSSTLCDRSVFRIAGNYNEIKQLVFSIQAHVKKREKLTAAASYNPPESP